MRKTVIKNIPARPAVPAKKKELVEVFCDVDGKSIGYVGGTGISYHCELCRRDICKEHAVRDYYHDGDYADIYCKKCFDLYEPARAELERRHEYEEEQMRDEIMKKSLAS